MQRIEAQDWDLLITDIELPGMNGLELLEQVRQLEPSLPVAVLTGNPTVDYAVSALRSAAAEFSASGPWSASSTSASSIRPRSQPLGWC